MADPATPTTALTEAYKKVVGDPANPVGTTPAGGAVYATPAGARPSGDIINISQAPSLALTPEQQLARDKFEWDKQQQVIAMGGDWNARRAAWGGGGDYSLPPIRNSAYQGWNRGANSANQPFIYSGGQGNVNAQLRPLNNVRRLTAPPGLHGPQLGTWADQQMKQAWAEGKAPPQIVQDIRS